MQSGSSCNCQTVGSASSAPGGGEGRNERRSRRRAPLPSRLANVPTHLVITPCDILKLLECFSVDAATSRAARRDWCSVAAECAAEGCQRLLSSCGVDGEWVDRRHGAGLLGIWWERGWGRWGWCKVEQSCCGIVE